MSQAQFADFLQIGPGLIGNWEAEPSARSLGNIATKLGVSVEWLSGQDEAHSPQPAPMVLREDSPEYRAGGDAQAWSADLVGRLSKLPEPFRRRVLAGVHASLDALFDALEGDGTVLRETPPPLKRPSSAKKPEFSAEEMEGFVDVGLQVLRREEAEQHGKNPPPSGQQGGTSVSPGGNTPGRAGESAPPLGPKASPVEPAPAGPGTPGKRSAGGN